MHACELRGQRGAFKSISLRGTTAGQRAELVRSARREILNLRRLSHSNIVQLVGAVMDVEDSVGLILELAPHGSLRKLLDSKPAEVVGIQPVQLRLAAGIAAGMAFLHALPPPRGPLLHHDLKSANVLLFNSDLGPVPKLADFG